MHRDQHREGEVATGMHWLAPDSANRRQKIGFSRAGQGAQQAQAGAIKAPSRH